MINEFLDKRVLVTGGSRGIGRAIVEAFAAAGAKVVFTYVSSTETATRIEEEYAAAGKSVFGFQADAASFAQAEEAVKFTLEKIGGIDILVNNAGITKDNLLMRMSEQEFDTVIDANLKSVFNYCRAVMKPMMGQRFGKIINISSVVAITGNPGQSNYCASKAGVIGFSKSLAKEVSSRNIAVNVVAPGFVTTDMTHKLNDKQKEAILSMIPFKRVADPSEIAEPVLFFASKAASYITGQVLAVDGGMTM